MFFLAFISKNMTGAIIQKKFPVRVSPPNKVVFTNQKKYKGYVNILNYVN